MLKFLKELFFPEPKSWKEKVNNHSILYSYKREGETHIFGADGRIYLVPEDMLPLTKFKIE